MFYFIGPYYRTCAYRSSTMKSISLFKGLSLLVVLNFLIKPVWIFFIDRQVQNVVGHEVYGTYFAVLNLSIVLSFLADAGLTNMVNQQLATGTVFSLKQIIGYKVVLAILYAFIVFLIAFFSGLKLWSIILPVVLIQILTSFFVFLRNIITAHQLFTTDAWLSVMDKVLMIFIVGSFLYLPFPGTVSLPVFLNTQIACTLLSIAVAAFVLVRKKITTQAEYKTIWQTIRSTFPFSILILLMSVHYRLDGFLLERIYPGGAYEAGIYASAFRLLDACNMLGYLAASFIVPFVAKNKLHKNLVEEVILSLRHVLFFGAAVIVSFALVFAGTLQQLLYHNNSAHAIWVTQLCIAALPGYFLVHLYGSVLTAAAQLRAFIFIVLISVIVNISFNLLLIPKYGAAGCSMAAFISQTFCGCSVYLIASKKNAIAFSFRSLLIYLVTGGGLFFIFYLGKHAALNYWLLLAVGVFITGLIMFAQIDYFRKMIFSLR